MLTVLKKELKSYLLSPIGYVFIGLFILIFSVFFYVTVYGYQVSNFEYLFYNGATILTFITPVLTMRMFSEERKTGTEQLIMTSPRSITSIVLGKFFASGIILFITELVSLMYFGILEYFGSPSLIIAIITLLGFLLLGLAYISFGLFASAITENQIIACIITIGVFLLMWFLPNIDGAFGTIAGIFSLISKFDNFAAGLVCLSDIITYVSFTLLFLILTIFILQRKKSVK